MVTRANTALGASDDNVNSGTPNAVATSSTVSTVNSSIYTYVTGLSNEQEVDMLYPGARKDNPLSKFSSYAYSISLYMVTPEYYNSFAFSNPPGTLPPVEMDEGIYVVAQSAGIDNSVDRRLLTKSRNLGPKQEGLDFYIEDFELETIMPTGADNLAIAVQSMSFKIIEPIGFSFLQDLAIASTRLNGLSKMASESPPNLMKQNYIIGIRFRGYDVNGAVVNPYVAGTSFNKTDPLSITERFIACNLTNMTFKLDSKATIYSFTATPISQQAALSEGTNTLSSTTGIVATNVTVNDALVGEAINSQSLMNSLNAREEEKRKIGQIEIPTTYEIEWVGGPNNPIAKSLLIDDPTVEKQITAMYAAKTTAGSNVGGSFKSPTYNKDTRSFSFAGGSSVVEAIDNIIVKSQFVSSALNAVNTGEVESEQKPAANLKELEWYYINPIATIKGRDPKTQNWAYKITYQIGVYKIPYIRTQYKNKSSAYPGPYKMYNYIYTGENNEILEYEQTYDALYTAISALTSKTTTNEPANTLKRKIGNIPVITAPSTNSNATGGKQNAGSALNENVRAQLYSPSDQQKAKITIMGDPDYIMTSIGVDQGIGSIYGSGVSTQGIISGTSAPRQLYGNDYSINPHGGQVFIQIAFGIATDYEDNGLLDVGNDIQFYETEDEQASGIRGFIYQVLIVSSSFSRGLFTQKFDMSFIPKPLISLANQKDNPVEPYSNTGTDVRTPQQSTANNQSSTNNSGNAQSNQNTNGTNTRPQVQPNQASADDDKNLSPTTPGAQNNSSTPASGSASNTQPRR
jgi:hypothetical protein